MLIIPLTLLVIFMILYSMFGSMKWAGLMLTNVAMAPIGGLLALLLTGTNFSVSSGVGFLALFGVSVQTGVIMVEYINQLRSRGYPIWMRPGRRGAAFPAHPDDHAGGVAGLVPAATSHGIGSDSQRPFAIVIVGGLMAVLVMSIFLLPTLYVNGIARGTDTLPKADLEAEVVFSVGPAWNGGSGVWTFRPPLEGGQSCPQPAFSRLSRLKRRLRPGLAALQARVTLP